MKSYFLKLIQLNILLSLLVFTSCDNDFICENGKGNRVKQTMVMSTIDRISNDISANVYIRYGQEQKVEIEGQNNIIAALNTSVNDGHWAIDFKSNRCYDYSSLNIYITLENLEYIGINGSGDIEMLDTFVSSFFETRILGSGDIIAKVEADETQGFLSGSGDLIIYGNSTRAEFEVTGSGDINARNHTTENAKANVYGSGDIYTYASETLNAKITGSGNIYYAGSPTVVSSISGSGNLIKE